MKNGTNAYRKENKTLSVRIPFELWATLYTVGSATRGSVSVYVREILQGYVDGAPSRYPPRATDTASTARQ